MARTKKNERKDFIEYGSDEHRALLGIDKLDPDDPNDAKVKAAYQKALDAGVPPVMSNKVPVDRRHYAPGEHIRFGFVREGR